MRERGDHILSNNSVPQQVRREDLGDMETNHLAWKQFSKLIGEGEGGGDHTCQTKLVPPASPEEETCRQTILETVFKVDVRERGEQK